MKQIFSIALIFSILTQSIGKLILLSNYHLNKEAIALKYCENKNKPKLHCDGKCYLKKQLKEQDKHEKTSENNTKRLNEVSFCKELSDILPQITSLPTNPHGLYLDGQIATFYTSTFHPPAV